MKAGPLTLLVLFFAMRAAIAQNEICCSCRCRDGGTHPQTGLRTDVTCSQTCDSACKRRQGFDRMVGQPTLGSCELRRPVALRPDQALQAHVYHSIALGAADVFVGPGTDDGRPRLDDIRRDEDLRKVLILAQNDTSGSPRNQQPARDSIGGAPLESLRLAAFNAVKRCQAETSANVGPDLTFVVVHTHHDEMVSKWRKKDFNDIRNSFRLWQHNDQGQPWARATALYCWPDAQIAAWMRYLLPNIQ